MDNGPKRFSEGLDLGVRGVKQRMESEPKKRRIEAPPRRVLQTSLARDDGDKPASSSSSVLLAAGTRTTEQSATAAMRFAVEESRKDHWLANFKPLESPFGNYILPVVPSRADFLQKDHASING